MIVFPIRKGDDKMLCQISMNEIKSVHKYACEHEIDIAELVEIINRRKDFIGDRDEHIYFNGIFKCVISVEHIPRNDLTNVYIRKRLSASFNIPGKYPAPHILKEIMKDLNFPEWDECDITKNENDPIPNIEISYTMSERPLTKDEIIKVKTHFLQS